MWWFPMTVQWQFTIADSFLKSRGNSLWQLWDRGQRPVKTDKTGGCEEKEPEEDILTEVLK